MNTTDKAAEALLLADELAALVDTYPQEDEDTPGGYCSVFDEQLDTAASWLREYAALLQAQPVACLVENESAIMAWPITCLDEARTYCDEGEEPVLLYARPQPAEAVSADNYAKVIEAALTEHVRFCPVGCSIDAFEWYRVVHPEALRALLEERKAMQAKIDALMLEFCPGEMTAEQVENWASHQKAALTTTADNQEPPKGQ